MKGSFRRAALAAVVFAAFLAFPASPAGAQVERVYTGVAPPVLGGVLASSGGRTAPPAAVAGQRQVLPLQVSSGAVAATQQAPIRGLAFTGADVATLVLIGFSAVGLGVVLTRRSRPRSNPQE